MMKSEREAVCQVVTNRGKITQVNLTTPASSVQEQNVMLLNWQLQPGEHYVRGRRYQITIRELDQHEGGDRSQT
jgi:hypothetical protein